MFRQAEDKDIADLMELTLAFCRQTPMSDLCEISVEKMTEIYLETIIDKKGYCWVSVDEGVINGFIIGRNGELPFTRDLSGIVICWWVDKKKNFHLIAETLLDLFSLEAETGGAKNIIAAAIGPRYSKVIENLYKRENYKSYETVYIKDIR